MSEILSGLRTFDYLIGELKGLNLVLSGNLVGKTSLLVNLVRTTLESGKTVWFFSHNQSKENIFYRLTCCVAGFNHNDVRRGTLSETDTIVFNNTKRAIEAQNISVVDDLGMSITDILRRIQENTDKMQKSDLIVVDDFISFICTKGDEKLSVKVHEATTEFREFAEKSDICILLADRISGSVPASMFSLLDIPYKLDDFRTVLFLERSGLTENKLGGEDKLSIKLFRDKFGEITTIECLINLDTGVISDRNSGNPKSAELIMDFLKKSFTTGRINYEKAYRLIIEGYEEILLIVNSRGINCIPFDNYILKPSILKISEKSLMEILNGELSIKDAFLAGEVQTNDLTGMNKLADILCNQ